MKIIISLIKIFEKIINLAKTVNLGKKCVFKKRFSLKIKVVNIFQYFSF